MSFKATDGGGLYSSVLFVKLTGNKFCSISPDVSNHAQIAVVRLVLGFSELKGEASMK